MKIIILHNPQACSQIDIVSSAWFGSLWMSSLQ